MTPTHLMESARYLAHHLHRVVYLDLRLSLMFQELTVGALYTDDL